MSLFKDQGIFSGNDRAVGLGMPYMGSKRKLAKPIIDFILKENPNAKYFYDLFGGGGAITFEALQRPQLKEVHYNELNAGVVALLKDVLENGVTEKYYKWIDRETFNRNKNKDTWFGGLCKVIWSFGNSQKGYLFSKNIEDDKRLLHEIVVNKCEKSLKIFNKKHKANLKLLEKDKTINERRLRIQRQIKSKLNSRIGELERLQQLQQLERLERLERLTGKLTIHQGGYDEVEISTLPNETIIYLDPPYEGTAKYEKDINHEKLLEWIEKSDYKIYLSSYEFNGLKEVATFSHRSTYSPSANNSVIEKLYTNR
jgi:site-specific DNA-adenine methylase